LTASHVNKLGKLHPVTSRAMCFNISMYEIDHCVEQCMMAQHDTYRMAQPTPNHQLLHCLL